MIEENKDLLKFNSEGVHPADMFLNARKVAIKAVDDFVAKHGEPMYCGFSLILGNCLIFWYFLENYRPATTASCHVSSINVP